MGAVDDVRERVDIVDLVGESVQLRRAGRIYKGLCPFHEERTPSFVVYPDSGRWQCFGACATGGDAFSFLMRLYNVPFREALEIMARRTGVELEPPSVEAEARRERDDRLREAVAAAAEAFHTALMRSRAGEVAREYLRRRGFSHVVARDFQLGWAPAERTATRDALREQGYDDEELLAAGLVRLRDDGSLVDTFRGRLTFPIRDAQGRTVGFGARTLEPDGVPKYLNSPQSGLFDKGHLLYGLDRARQAIRSTGRVVVVEGYTDVIRAHTAGFQNVVASLGTALTEWHVQLLKRYTKDIVLALDADPAGQAATVRGLGVALEAAAGEVAPVPTASGSVRYRHRSDVKLHVATLPTGLDPDDVIRDAPDTWRVLVDEARPMMAFLFDFLTLDLDLLTPEGKTDAADRLMPLVADIDDPIARGAWTTELARRLDLDERTIAARLVRLELEARRTSARQSAGVVAGSAAAQASTATGDSRGGGGSPALERDTASWLLSQLLIDPHRLRGVNAYLEEAELGALGDGDWERGIDRDLFQAVRHASRGGAPPDAPAEHRLDALPEPLASHARALEEWSRVEPPLDDRRAAAALRDAALRMREAATRGALAAVRAALDGADGVERRALESRLKELSARLLHLQTLLHPPLTRGHGSVDPGPRA
jgi:DNA primase